MTLNRLYSTVPIDEEESKEKEPPSEEELEKIRAMMKGIDKAQLKKGITQK